MPETLSNSIVGLLKDKGEMTSSDMERELKEKSRAVIGALDYLVRRGKVFYCKKVVGSFSVRKIYFVVS